MAVTLRTELTEARALYHAAAERGDRPAMHRLEAFIASTIKLLRLGGYDA